MSERQDCSSIQRACRAQGVGRWRMLLFTHKNLCH